MLHLRRNEVVPGVLANALTEFHRASVDPVSILTVPASSLMFAVELYDAMMFCCILKGTKFDPGAPASVFLLPRFLSHEALSQYVC